MYKKRKAILSLFAAVLILNACTNKNNSSAIDTEGQNNVGQGVVTNPVENANTVENLTDVAPLIVVDQFGYLPQQRKVAILRNPKIGFDENLDFEPIGPVKLINTATGATTFTALPMPWNNGTTDTSSGDQVWRFDFSIVDTPGNYRVIDNTGSTSSAEFVIGRNVYNDVLKQAFRTFYYQRAGSAKAAPYADARWADAASHIGIGQDKEARLFSQPENVTTALDLSGGWYDAGDYNRYTTWTADYVVSLLHNYIENPDVWTDDFGIPESGNGTPDIIDEIQWGLEWLMKMQNADGSALSVLGVASGSPPSSATGPSFYGPANTSATLSIAAAFALAANVLNTDSFTIEDDYIANLSMRATSAWNWATLNPAVVFRNNDESFNSVGLAAGQQEVEEQERTILRLSAAIYLADLTNEPTYFTTADQLVDETLLVESGYASPFQAVQQRDLLHYSSLTNTDDTVKNAIQAAYVTALNDERFWLAVDNDTDAYLAYLDQYTWGSNSVKAQQGIMYLQLARFGLNTRPDNDVFNAASHYLHYLHGVNPLGLSYLSNMSEFGAERSVSTLYHSWFADGNPNWDSTQTSNFGPVPGLLTGGPNPSYEPDQCCPQSCGAANFNQMCELATLPPFVGQPDQKAYSDFNTSWPLNSWQMTENSNKYQTAYLRLLAHFVNGQ